jgi:hypothetical protein
MSYTHIVVIFLSPHTIDVPFVNMAQDIMILMRENPNREPLEGVDLESRDIFWVLKWQQAK